MKQRRQSAPVLSNSKPVAPTVLGKKAPTPLNDAALRHVAGGVLPVKGW